MPRYIDADKFLKSEIKRCGYEPVIGTCTNDNKSLKDVINEFPTVDAQEVSHGKWYDVCDNHQQSNYQEEAYGTCSVCKVRGRLRTNRNEYGIWFIDSPYCPNCGAIMNGDENR